MRSAMGACVLLACGGTPTAVIPAATELPNDSPALWPTARPAQTGAASASAPPSAAKAHRGATPAASMPNPTPASALAARVDRFYAGTGAFACDVLVQRTFKIMDTKSTLQARVVFERPGRFHLAVPGGLAIVDAQVETTWDPATGAGARAPVAADHCPVAFAFAAGPGVLSRRMELRVLPGAQLRTHLDVLDASPRVVSPRLAKVLLYIEPTGEVTRTLAITQTGDRERFDFSNRRPARPAPALFAPPALAAVKAPSAVSMATFLDEPLP